MGAKSQQRRRVIAQRKRPGRVAYISVYDLQGSPLNAEFMDGLEEVLEKYLNDRPDGSSKAITVVQE